MAAKFPPLGDSVHRRKRLKSRGVAVHGIRITSVFMAALFLCHSLYYSTSVTRDLGKTMFSYKTVVNTFSDFEIYPRAFQKLHNAQQSYWHPAYTDPSSWNETERFEIRDRFQRHNRASTYSLLLIPKPNETNQQGPITDTVLAWDHDFDFVHEHVRKRHKQGLYESHDLHGRDFEKEEDAAAYRTDPAVLKAAWGSDPDQQPQRPRLIEEHNICHAFKNAKKIANFSTPHVLLTHLNENWGTLSSEVPGRTAQWGDIVRNTFGEHDGFDCDAVEVKEKYLDSPNTLAVFTTQHQSLFDHPKVHSLPLGIDKTLGSAKKRLEYLRKQQFYLQTLSKKKNQEARPQLLMINSSNEKTRLPQMEAVIKNFGEKGVFLQNSFSRSKDGLKRYYNELTSSKFIMCPSGLGWDAYRIWEALIMGTIPVIERHTTRYEILTYPPGSDRPRKIIRTLQKGEQGGDLKATRKTKEGEKLKALETFEKDEASLDVIEYEDGWRKTLEDLPVVWIDGEFGDIPPANGADGKKYLTPELLEREYDALAAKMESFRYDKLTSLYWVRFIESFLLLEDPSLAHLSTEGPTTFDSPAEEQRWHAAMESLSSTYNNHSFFPRRVGDGWDWELWRTDPRFPDGPSTEVNDEPEDPEDLEDPEDPVNSYLFGEQQPRVLSWLLLIQLKLLGFVLVIVGSIKLIVDEWSPRNVESKTVD